MAYQNYNQPGFGGFGGVPLNQPVPMLADESGQAGGGMPAGTDPFDWMLFNNTQIPHELKLQIQQARLSGNNQAMNELIFNSGLPQDFKMQLSQSGAGRAAYQRPPQQPRTQPGQQPPQGGGGGPVVGGTGGAPVGGGSQYPDWFVQAGQQNGMNPRQMEVEWQRFMQSQGGGGPVYASNDPRAGSGYWDERIPDGGFGGGGGRYGGAPLGGGGTQAPPMYSGNSEVPRGGYGQMGSPRQFDPSRTGGPRGNEGGKVGGRQSGGPQVGMIGGSPVSNWDQSSGRLLGSGKDNSAPAGQAAGSGKWQYHANGSRTWKPNKPKPTKKPPTTTRPPVVVKPGPDGGPTPQPSPSANNDNVPSTSNKPPVATTPPIYVPGSEMRQSSGSMPSLAASLNKRRPG